MQPWPTAYAFLRRSDGLPIRVIISKATVREPPALAGGEEQPTSPANAGGSPGAVLVSGQQFVALTGTGTVEILELQPAGKKRMTAAEFLRGYQLQPGDCFSSKSE
jgi:methionyl-tRNA formyltransferase